MSVAVSVTSYNCWGNLSENWAHCGCESAHCTWVYTFHWWGRCIHSIGGSFEPHYRGVKVLLTFLAENMLFWHSTIKSTYPLLSGPPQPHACNLPWHDWRASLFPEWLNPPWPDWLDAIWPDPLLSPWYSVARRTVNVSSGHILYWNVKRIPPTIKDRVLKYSHWRHYYMATWKPSAGVGPASKSQRRALHTVRTNEN